MSSSYTIRKSLQTTSASSCRIDVTDFVSSICNLKTDVLSNLRLVSYIEYNRLLEVGLNFLISLFTFTFDILYPIVKVGHTDDYSHGAVKLSVSLVDKDAMKKISVTVIGYFEINIDENITDILYVNGTAILYHYLRSIVSIVSAIDSSEAMLLPTINVLELLDKSQPFEEE
ncbi:Uncharacterised protein [Streptococcus pneumoniae]|nr:Uncharacterised protein [Streptococcus pneumoniae]